MRPLYLFLKFSLFYSLRLIFKTVKLVNKPGRKRRMQAIFVSNHPSAFLDPITIAPEQKPIVYFMVRSDIFKKWIIPITNSAHMLPIYRQGDGEGALAKNEAIFNRYFSIIKNRRSLLLFGEGFTDDTFIRRLKPLKKGPARIAFGTMDKYNWEFDLKIYPCGLNYTNPNHFRSEMLLSYADPIDLNDYKELYLENPNKAQTKLTKDIEVLMKEQITHINNAKLSSLHEGIMRITRKGMNELDSDFSIPLEKRWRYSQKLANHINEFEAEKEENVEILQKLQKEVAGYFNLIKKFRLKEKFIYEFSQKGKISSLKYWLYVLLLLPIVPLGLLHNGLPYLATKKMVEKVFRRKVFWGGMKMMIGKLFSGLYNIPFIFLFHAYVYESYLLGFAYYYLVPTISGFIAYRWFQHVGTILEIRKIKKAKIDLNKFVSKRESAEKQINEIIGEIKV
jgi:1-acyl-sn-glycerol-3-phosphate acyltransferase